MNAHHARLLIFAKYPRSGSVKTRLAPTLSYDDAALLYRAFLLDAIATYGPLDGLEPVLYMAAGEDVEPMRVLLDELGLAPGMPIRAQQGSTLGDRLENAFADAFAEGCDAAGAIGTDHPTLPVAFITRAFDAIAARDVVIGPSIDGGYYLIVMKAHHPELFRSMPYSTAELCRRTAEAARGLSLGTELLDAWYDVDDAGSLAALWNHRALVYGSGYTAAELERLAEPFAALVSAGPSDAPRP